MSSKHIFAGRIVDLVVDTVVLPNGHKTDLEVVRHPGGAAVVAVEDQGRVCLLRQYRHAAGGWLWELPAGKIDHPESPLETARRELAEEAGVGAQHWEPLGTALSSPGVLTEVIHLYLARDLEVTCQATEPGEVLEVHWVGLASAVDRAHAGDIVDAKSVIGLLRADRWLQDDLRR